MKHTRDGHTMKKFGDLILCAASLLNHVFPAECSYTSAIYVRQFNYNAITAVSSSSQLQSTVVLREASCYIHCAQTQQCTSFTYNTTTTECILYSGYLDTPPLNAATSNYYITKDASICSNMGYTYDEAIRLCYKFHYDKSTEEGAKLTCVAEGGRLFRIDSSKKQQLVAAFPITDNGRYRIDGRRLNDIWLLSTGSELPYTNWGSGMPRTGTKGCLTIHLPSGDWMNSSCDNEKKYICERLL